MSKKIYAVYPWTHIWDKYQNSYSPKFRSDLMESERKAAYDIELGMFQFDGKLQGCNMQDATFRNIPKLMA